MCHIEEKLPWQQTTPSYQPSFSAIVRDEFHDKFPRRASSRGTRIKTDQRCSTDVILGPATLIGESNGGSRYVFANEAVHGINNAILGPFVLHLFRQNVHIDKRLPLVRQVFRCQEASVCQGDIQLKGRTIMRQDEFTLVARSTGAFQDF